MQSKLTSGLDSDHREAGVSVWLKIVFESKSFGLSKGALNTRFLASETAIYDRLLTYLFVTLTGWFAKSTFVQQIGRLLATCQWWVFVRLESSSRSQQTVTDWIVPVLAKNRRAISLWRFRSTARFPGWTMHETCLNRFNKLAFRINLNCDYLFNRLTLVINFCGSVSVW